MTKAFQTKLQGFALAGLVLAGNGCAALQPTYKQDKTAEVKQASLVMSPDELQASATTGVALTRKFNDGSIETFVINAGKGALLVENGPQQDFLPVQRDLIETYVGKEKLLRAILETGVDFPKDKPEAKQLVAADAGFSQKSLAWSQMQIVAQQLEHDGLSLAKVPESVTRAEPVAGDTPTYTIRAAVAAKAPAPVAPVAAPKTQRQRKHAPH